MTETFTQRRRAQRPGVVQLRKLIVATAATPDPDDVDGFPVTIDDLTAERIADAILDWTATRRATCTHAHDFKLIADEIEAGCTDDALVLARNAATAVTA